MKIKSVTKRRISGLVALLLCGGANQAVGSVTTYSSLTDFTAATTGLTTIGFEGIAPSNSFMGYGNGGSLTLSGVTFSTSPDVFLYVDSSSYYAANFGLPGYNLDSGDFLLAGSGGLAVFSITLPTASTAVAFDLGTFDTPTSGVTITSLPTGDILSASAPYPSHTFIGFTSSTPIAGLQIAISCGNRQDTLTLDNFSFGTAVIPEPSTLSLLAVGLAALTTFRWKHRRVTVSFSFSPP